MKKLINLLFIALRLFLGGFMIYGGIEKFEKPNPTPVEVVKMVEKMKSPDKESVLKKILYIRGAKQTGYFWEVLGISELLFGLLILLQTTSFVGAVFLLPITFHIFLFHLFLEPDDIGELFLTASFFIINIALILKEKAHWKQLLWIKVT